MQQIFTKYSFRNGDQTTVNPVADNQDYHEIVSKFFDCNQVKKEYKKNGKIVASYVGSKDEIGECEQVFLGGELFIGRKQGNLLTEGTIYYCEGEVKRIDITDGFVISEEIKLVNLQQSLSSGQNSGQNSGQIPQNQVQNGQINNQHGQGKNTNHGK